MNDMIRNKYKKVKIWWKIPDLTTIPNNEARELIYRTLCAASDAYYRYYNILEEPTYFKSFWLTADLEKSMGIYNFMIGKVNDPRVQYFAEIK
jgi:hypothetical protein